MATENNASTGGILVILGIVVAIAIAFFLFQSGVIGSGNNDAGTTNISVDMPDQGSAGTAGGATGGDAGNAQ